jgi:hypothetical protein
VKPLRALLGDRRRAQRGSVLSGVLIITAFLAIISGALVTELSTHFLLSRALVNRVANEATVNSAMELALDQLQNTPLASGCPGLTNMPPVNGRQASVSYVSCWPTVRESPQFRSIASSAAFNIDATHSVIPGAGKDVYLVGDSGGRLYQYAFGSSRPTWSKDLGTSITGPPLAMQAVDPRSGVLDPQEILNLVPIAGSAGSGCTASACVELLAQYTLLPAPDVFCFMPATAPVTSRPAAGVAFPQVAYFGDSGGTLYASTATEYSCGRKAFVATPGNAAIIAGPIVFPNGNRDEVYVVTSVTNSKGTTINQLLHYTYQENTSPSLTLSDTLTLSSRFSNAVGVAVEKNGVPAKVAITFAGGGVAVVQIDSTFHPSLVKSAGLAAGIAAAPYWCSCPAGSQIGVTGLNGTLYVLDANLLTPVGSYQVPSASAIRTAPASDGVGQWYFGADDGYLYELQQTPGQPALVQVGLYGDGRLGKVGSSVQVAGCPAGICVYLGSANNAYIVSLDARDARLTACLTNSPPACSGDNPRLWAQVEVGSISSPQTVHVQGWSYYSP